MGYNNQSEAKRSIIGLLTRYYKQWPKHLVAKSLEDIIINSYLNFLLDPGCISEKFTTYIYNFVQELQEAGENMRKTKPGIYKQSRNKGLKRPRPGSDAALLSGMKCRGGYLSVSIKEVPINKRSKRCQFCKREKALYRCRSCGAHLCMKRPREMPGGIRFPGNPGNGLFCFIRYHGINSFSPSK